MVSRKAHNLEVVGSIPTSATKLEYIMTFYKYNVAKLLNVYRISWNIFNRNIAIDICLSHPSLEIYVRNNDSWDKMWSKCFMSDRFIKYVAAHDKYIMFDEECVKNLNRIKELIVDAKTRFDHVRGDVENREIMVDTIDRAIEIINNNK